MINIESTSLYNEVLAVRQDGAKPVNFTWSAELHLPIGDFTASQQVLKIMEIDTVRDYELGIGDETTVRMQIPMGFWAKKVYPNRTEIEITIFRKTIGETAGVAVNAAVQAQRFMASLKLEGLTILQGKDIEMISEETLNLRGLVDVTFQLINKTLDKLRMVTVGGIYRKTTGEQVVKAILAGESNKVLADSGDAIEAINMVPATNQDKREHVMLPQGLKLPDVATYIQDKCGGLYSSGLNCYMQGRTWYIYPLYDNTRLKTEIVTATVVKIPQTLSKGGERTYRQNGGETIILGTSDSDFSDDAGTQYLNEGNGVRFADANKFMNKGLVTTLNNKAVALRGQLLNEVVTEAITGRNTVFMSDRKITANPYREYSKMAARNGAKFIFQWDNSDPGLLTPGMMMKILYLNGNNVDRLTGVLLRTHTLVQLQGANIQSERYISTTAVGVFVNKSTQ